MANPAGDGDHSKGLTSSEIADKLLVSLRTVDAHIVAVQERLQVENWLQALCKTVSLGLALPMDAPKVEEDQVLVVMN